MEDVQEHIKLSDMRKVEETMERTAQLEKAWRMELTEFYSNYFWEESIDPFREELARLFDIEVSDKKKGSYTWSLYEIMNCLNDEDLRSYDVSLVGVAEDVEFLVDRWNALIKKYIA